MTNVTKLWFGILFCASLLTFVKTEDAARNTNDQATKCDVEECQRLRDRLETLEEAVKTIISALASQKNRLFTPINAILERDSVLRSIVLPPSSHIKQQNIALQPKEEVKNSTKQPENYSSSQLKGAIKCSLIQLLDINFNENPELHPGSIKAALGVNNSLEIEWTPYSNECLKSSSGVWIRVFESGKKPPGSDSYLDIPQKCLKRKSSAAFSIVFPHSSSEKVDRKTCHFELNVDLIQCRSYTVELVPNYQSFKGTPIFTEIVIPSADSLDSMLLIKFYFSPEKLTFSWKDQSGCASQLTSFNFKIFLDGKINGTKKEISDSSFFKIPRSCLNQNQELATVTNEFAVTLPLQHSCEIPWVSLDSCRKYTVEVTSDYSNTWTSAPSLWDIFTKHQTDESLGMMFHQYSSVTSNCSINHVHCQNARRDYGHIGKCIPKSYVCNQRDDCRGGIDETNCDNQCIDKFRCGHQCIDYEKVCDKKIDCLDGSDELHICDYSCNQVTAESGLLSSYASTDMISSLNVKHGTTSVTLSKKSMALITVQLNQTIWLAFNKFNVEENHILKVYDGPFSTSPLLLSHSGAANPPSIRSSHNELYIEFIFYLTPFLGTEIYYISINSTGKPFVSGCGGYVYDTGVISIQSFPTGYFDGIDCVWFLEAEQEENVILLKKVIAETNSTQLTNSAYLPIMTVYNGWNLLDEIIYEEQVSSHFKNVLYLNSRKTMVKLRWPKIPSEIENNGSIYWTVHTMSVISQSVENLDETSETIKSPNYPLGAYPNLIDYRWNIKTKSSSKIRILFAFFETQQEFDYVYVYDGPTINSPLLLEKSGSTTLPFAVNSTSHQLLVRFTSDDVTALSGFLAVCSTI